MSNSLNFVKHRFRMCEAVKDEIQLLTPQFGYNGYGEIIFYDKYSRIKNEATGEMESWNDVVIRVTEGIFSIRKDHYIKNHIPWDRDFWNVYSRGFALSLFQMKWMPPGRGLWAMGTNFIYQRGSMALQNCGFKFVGDNIGTDVDWIMDALMCGVGVGFYPERNDDIKIYEPIDPHTVFEVQDTRESWAKSTGALIDSYINPGSSRINFDYTKIREEGDSIKGFGGVSAGYKPLEDLHKRIRSFMQMAIYKQWYDSVMLKMDIVNSVGVCVVSGNVRRSAELACAPIDDPIFLDLKNYERYKYRSAHGWMSNNSVFLYDDSDFELLGYVADANIKNHDVGYINLRNITKGRIGKNDGIRDDSAIGFNPCGEQPLEDGELCTLAETLPTRCSDSKDWLKACEYATVYASTVTLLPTHRPETNSVMLRNRRIGVGIIDVSGWKYHIGTNTVIKNLRKGYKHVRKINQWVNSEAGIPEAIRVTTIKPGGTTPKLAGRTAGRGNPTFNYTLRRTRIAKNSPMYHILHDANIPHEPDINDPSAEVFEYPILQGPAKPINDVPLFEQAMDVVMLQREWSDNAVSNTLYFKDIEEESIESVLSIIAPMTKSVSLCRHTMDGIFPQMPESGITIEEYNKRLADIKPINWSKLRHNVAKPEKYCTGDTCETQFSSIL